MQLLVIGATGFVGRSLARLLLGQGHRVAGLARSAEAAAALAAAGCDAVPGDVLEPESFIDQLAQYNGVVFMPRIDLHNEYRVVKTLLAALEGTDKPFVFTSGTGVFVERTDGDWRGTSYAEDDPFTRSDRAGERCETEDLVRASAGRGIRGMVIRPPLIWGYGHQRALSAVHASARSGAVCHLGRGLNVMSSIHVDDLAEIFGLALDRGVAGALYHAVSGEHSWRSIAAEVGRLRGLPTRSVDLAEARDLFGQIIAEIVFAVHSSARCPRTHRELGWSPSPDRLDIYAELSHPTFMAEAVAPNQDLDAYFTKPTAA